jgi:hypothetical protein
MERLTRDGVLARQASLSPDGNRVAFISWGGERFEIWCVDVATRRSWRVSPVGGPSRTRPLWSMDGKVLVYQVLEGATRRELAGWLDEKGESVTSEMEIRPDHPLRNSAFAIDRSGRVEISAASDPPVSAAALARIASLRPAMFQKGPDGEAVFFQAAHGGWFNVWRLNPDSPPEQITHFRGSPHLLSDTNREFAVHRKGLIVNLRENRSDLWLIR